MTSFDGKIILVTGGAKRIGSALIRAFAEEQARMVIHYHSSEKEAEALAKSLPTDVLLVQADLADPASIAQMFTTIREELGHLDILVNNAAIFGKTDFLNSSADDFDHYMNVNARSVYECSRHAARLMLGIPEGETAAKGTGRMICTDEVFGPEDAEEDEAGEVCVPAGGVIVNMADMYALRTLKNHAPYIASKAAVISLTKSLARDLAPWIRVNAVAPGFVLPAKDSNTKQNREIIEQTPLRRKVSPEEVAETVLFLCREPNAMTGEILTLDGGRSLTF